MFFLKLMISDRVLPPTAKTRVKDPLPLHRFSNPFL